LMIKPVILDTGPLGRIAHLVSKPFL